MSDSNKGSGSNSSGRDTVDEASRESFPASDPPAWTIVKKVAGSDEPTKQKVSLIWERNTDDFSYESYNRDAVLTFAGGESLEVSNPPEYFGDAHYANSEELLLAAVSFCYMHTLLALASKQGFKIKRYSDNAVGILGKNPQGVMMVTDIALNPKIQFEQNSLNDEQLLKLQQSAHKYCFIANSLVSKVTINIMRLGV